MGIDMENVRVLSQQVSLSCSWRCQLRDPVHGPLVHLRTTDQPLMSKARATSNCDNDTADFQNVCFVVRVERRDAHCEYGYGLLLSKFS